MYARVVTYVVVCRDDRKPDGSKGDYTLATRRAFALREDAEAYARGLSESLDPIVVRVDYSALRVD